MYLQVQVRHKDTADTDPKSPLKGPVQAIIAGIAPILHVDGSSPTCVERVRNCLQLAYGSQAKEVAQGGPVYELVRNNGGEFCLVCTSFTNMEVDFSPEGVVAVDIRESVHYEMP